MKIRKYNSLMCRVIIYYGLFMLFSANVVYVQVSWAAKIVGEIINVNPAYNTAHTDLNSPSLDVGDILEIFDKGNFITHVRVNEISADIATLGPILTPGRYTTKISFDQIRVGSNVIKIGQVDLPKLITAHNRNKQAKQELAKRMKLENLNEEIISDNQELVRNNYILDEEVELLKSEIQRLMNDQKQLETKNALLTQENKTLSTMQYNTIKDKTEIELLRRTLDELKIKLIGMNHLIRGNEKITKGNLP